MNRIVIKDVIKNNIAVSTDDGNEVYKTINENLQAGNSIIIDFGEIIILTTAFLNVAIGKLYATKEYTSDYLNQKIQLVNVAPEDVVLFKKVVERAKEYFNTKSEIDKSANETIDD